jgi:hypothetical protein
MQCKSVSAVLLLIFCLLFITGCESLDLGPNPAVITGPTPPPAQKTQENMSYEKPRLTAPDEEAPLGATPPSALQTVRAENLDGSPVSRQRTPLPQAGAKSTLMIFTGKVTRIDAGTREIGLQTSDKRLAFDLVNPQLRGYQNLADIKVGDTVSLGYIPSGIAIAKGEAFPEDLKAQTTADDPSPVPRAKTNKSKKGARNHGAPVRVKYKVNRMSFAEVDNNKDGKISPIELCTVMPSVTMESFRQYDRNGDGFLEANEYRSVRK